MVSAVHPIALDLVLLPEPEVRDLCIRYNSALDGRLVLGAEDRLPHCSLFMLVADRSALPVILNTVRTLYRETAGLKLVSDGVRLFRREKRPSLIHLGIKRSEALVRLHAAAVRRLAPFALGECPDSAFILDDGEQLSESSRSWVLGFGEKSSGELYDPHITLGYGSTVTGPGFPDGFRAELGLFQLGTHCSCRTRLV